MGDNLTNKWCYYAGVIFTFNAKMVDNYSYSQALTKLIYFVAGIFYKTYKSREFKHSSPAFQSSLN